MTKYWTGAANDGNLENPANWSDGQVPDPVEFTMLPPADQKLQYRPTNPYAAHGRPASRRGQAPGPKRDPFAAGLMSFYFPGLGQIYCGRVGRGLVIMFGGPTASIVAGVLALRASLAAEAAGGSFGSTFGPLALAWGLVSFGAWLWQVWDAAQLAKRT